jgi:type II secretory pathway component PulJ
MMVAIVAFAVLVVMAMRMMEKTIVAVVAGMG